jgi:hypothetical protein
MHLRRAVLLMALVLGVVALVEALVPLPRDRGRPAQPRAAPAPVAAPPVRTIRLRYPPTGRLASVRVATGAHVVIEVDTSTAGQASLAGLGLVQEADSATPGRFDLLATRPGAYDVTFEPAARGGAARLGRLVVGRPG